MGAVAILRWDRWFVVARPGSPPQPSDLAGVLSLIDPQGVRHGCLGSDHVGDVGVTDALHHGEVVAPVWCLAGRITPSGIATEDADGDPFVVAPDELALLDALAAPMTVGELLETTGCPERSLRRLVVAGKVLRGEARIARQVEEADGGSPVDPLRLYATVVESPRHPMDDGGPGRIPVYALWHRIYGPQLGLGMVTAAARAHEGGALTRTFEIRRPELETTIREDIGHRPGRAVLLLSNFIWTIEDNLRVARDLVAIDPDLVVVHGGPSTPRHKGDVERFLSDYRDIAHILVRGEGEGTIGEVLAAIAAGDAATWPLLLSSVKGISFLDPESGSVVTTSDRPRTADPGALVSPYLTGEFDHIDFFGSTVPMALETNRGCPYSCTYCDWGSATNSRIRSFPMDRVRAEIDWLAARGIRCVMITDANFGIHSRDEETARYLVEARARTGAFSTVYWHPTKNTTKRLIPILTTLREGGILSDLSIGLQTVDEATLEAVGRSNISTDRLLDLAREMRRASLPLTADLMLGLPGQTRESYRRDLQLAFDEEMSPRTWITLALPNAPMNDPSYRDDWGVRIGDNGSVVETSTCSQDDVEAMLRLRQLFMAADVYGTLRHLLRWLQWDHDVLATVVLERISTLAIEDPFRYPALTWLVECFDRHPVPMSGWTEMYEQVAAFVVDEYGVGDDSALGCVLAVQQALMPWPGRVFPHVVDLEHDYVSYYHEAVAPLYWDVPTEHHDRLPLRSWGPARLDIAGDPTEVGRQGMNLVGDPRTDFVGASYNIVTTTSHEVDSPLLRLLPEVIRRFDPVRIAELTSQRLAAPTSRAPFPSVR